MLSQRLIVGIAQSSAVGANKVTTVKYEAFVGNIGLVGHYATLAEAIRAVEQTIEQSSRADGDGYVFEIGGELVWSIDVSE